MPQIGHGRSLFDNTPVNGELEKGISSNWAFDEDVTLRALIEATLPWVIFIDVFQTPNSNTNWDTIYISTAYAHCAAKTSSGAQNAEISWNIVLGAGTWSIELLFEKDVDRGIFSAYIDGTLKGTIDAYKSSTQSNVRDSITGIVIPTTGKITLKLKIATKHTSSNGYATYLQKVSLIRTA